MSETISAIFKNGVFIPEEALDFPEGSKVQIAVELEDSLKSDSAKREESIREFLKRAGQRKISPEAPAHLTREELHERR